MSKKCAFCNAEMADDAVQCPECEKYIRGYENAKRIKKNKEQQTKKTLIITICSAAAAILIFLAASAVINVVKRNSEEADSDYIKVFDKYIEATLECDYEKYLSLYPDFYAKEIDDMFSYIGGNGQDYFTRLKDDMVSQFGYINGITYKVNSENAVSDSQAETYINEWKTLYDLPDSTKVSAIYSANIKFQVSGRNESYEDTQNIMFARINGKWYIMNLVYFLDTSKYNK